MMKFIGALVAASLLWVAAAFGQGLPFGQVGQSYGALNFNGYGTLRPTTQPSSAVADFIAINDRYHDNILTLENDSVIAGGTAIGSFSSFTAGSGLTNGVYNGVALTGGGGSGATANIVVAGGVCVNFQIAKGGSGVFAVGNTMTTNVANIGGAGSACSATVGSLTGSRGNAAIRSRGSVTGYDRTAYGFNAENNQSFLLGRPVWYSEIGNIGPQYDTYDTDAVFVNTHNSVANYLPNTSYTMFELLGRTGDLNWYTSDGTVNGSIVGFSLLASNHKAVFTGLTPNPNTLTIDPNTGSAVLITAGGTGASIGVDLVAKGAASVVLQGNGRNVLSATNTSGSAINYFQFTGAISGSPPSIAAASVGADTNIDFVITPLGTGVLQLGNPGSWIANGTVATTMTSLGPTGSHTTIQEWIAVKNSSGTTRYVPGY